MILAEIIRLLTHSSKLEYRQREGMVFYRHMRARAYPRQDLAEVFAQITWNQRSQILNHTTKKKESCSFLETCKACVLTLRNAQEWLLLKERLDLRLTELIQSTYRDIFPPIMIVFLAQYNASGPGSIIKN